MLDVAGEELLDPGPRSSQLAAENDLAAKSSALHHPSEGGLARLSEVPASLQGAGQPVCHHLGVQLGLAYILDVDLGVIQPEVSVQVPGQLSDQFAALADDHSRLFGVYCDLDPHGGPVHHHAAVPGPTELLGQELVDQGFGEAVLYKFLLYAQVSSPRSISSLSIQSLCPWGWLCPWPSASSPSGFSPVWWRRG